MPPPFLAALWARVLRPLLVAAAAASLAATFALLAVERTWDEPKDRSGEGAFRDGTIGTEAVPTPVLRVLPGLFPDYFQPAGPQAGDWVAQFGLVRRNPGDELPVGFTSSNYRPRSGAPSPVPFVGFGCALCHTTRVYTSEADPEGVLIEGAGNASLDFLPWVDAFRAAVLDEDRLTPETVERAYAEKGFQPALGPAARAMIRVWLAGTRRAMRENLPKYDAPVTGPDARGPDHTATGPSRTQPFRNLVRVVLDRPAATDRAYTKFPPVFHQGRRTWAQFDGSVRDYHARSALAALSAGATAQNMTVPEIRDDIVRATDHTLRLPAPAFAGVFRVNPDPMKVARGREVYAAHCFACHGRPGPGPGEWETGPRHGDVVPAAVLGTDPERVNYRYYDDLSGRLHDWFPRRHPLGFPREAIRPGPEGATRGYINAPLEGAWVRAPFLHNGSVLTLAELINLKPRRAVFLRGRNAYDPEWVGLLSPKDDPGPSPTARLYFRFDASRPGNGNRGHDYPWPYRTGEWNEPDLVALLEYLKTF
jgi:hypothetical protein